MARENCYSSVLRKEKGFLETCSREGKKENVWRRPWEESGHQKIAGTGLAVYPKLDR